MTHRAARTIGALAVACALAACATTRSTTGDADRRPRTAMGAVHSMALAMVPTAETGDAALATLEATTRVRVGGVRVRSHFDQRIEGESGTMAVERFTEWRDHAAEGRRYDFESIAQPGFVWEGVIVEHTGRGAMRRRDSWGGRPGEPELRVLAPEHVLVAAAHAPDLTLDPDGSTIRFTAAGAACAVHVDPISGRPDVVSMTRELPWHMTVGPWGPTTTEHRYRRWLMAPNGELTPRLIEIRENGIDAIRVEIEQVELAWRDGETSEALFDIPADASPFEMPPPALPGEPRMIGDRVCVASGMYATAFVRTDRGVFVIDAPAGRAFARATLDLAAATFPNERIAGVVCTASTWFYLAGLPEFADRGIPIYALRDHTPIIEGLLEHAGTKRPRICALGPITTIGSGDGAITLVEFSGGNPRLMAWIPSARALYGADLANDTNFPTWRVNVGAGVADVIRCAQTNGWDPESVWGMHMHVKPWAEWTASADL